MKKNPYQKIKKPTILSSELLTGFSEIQTNDKSKNTQILVTYQSRFDAALLARHGKGKGY